MHLASILALSVGLAMDAMAVSAARGLAAPRLRLKHAALVAVFFGGFQALMPLFGWLLGASVGALVARWDHWIAFVLLGAIGLKMLHEARTAQPGAVPSEEEAEAAFAFKPMLVLAIATSIDALAAGVTLPTIGTPLPIALACIGLVTAVLSALGLVLGRRFGAALGKRLDAFGGLVLIGLGVKILVEHLGAE